MTSTSKNQSGDDADQVGTQELVRALQRAGVHVGYQEERQALADQLHDEGVRGEHIDLMAAHFEQACRGDRYAAAKVLAGTLKRAGTWRKTVEDINAFRAGFGGRGSSGEVNRPFKPFESKAGRDSYVRYLHEFDHVPKEVLAEQLGATVAEIEAILKGKME